MLYTGFRRLERRLPHDTAPFKNGEEALFACGHKSNRREGRPDQDTEVRVERFGANQKGGAAYTLWLGAELATNHDDEVTFAPGAGDQKAARCLSWVARFHRVRFV